MRNFCLGLDEVVKDMAEREFLTREQAQDAFVGYDEYNFAYYVLDEVQAITEQDIVKPYLTKLKAKMFDLPKAEGKTYWDAVDDIGDLINNLFSEQGDKNEDE